VRQRVPLAVLGLAALLVGRAEARTFREILGRRAITEPVGQAMAVSIGRSLPLTAASAGLSFTFNPETHAFERETEILGQLFLERPRPLGRGKLNVSLNYQFVRIDEVDGADLDRLHDTRFPIVDRTPQHRLFTLPRFGLDLDTHQVTTSATYGVTDSLDLNLTVPVLYSDFAVHAVARDRLTGQMQHSDVRSTKLGIGDVFVRGKQRLVHGAFGDLAAGLVLRAPAGNQDNFQGTGRWELGPHLYGATPSYALRPGVRLQGYGNGGVGFDVADAERSEARFGFGVDCALGERATVAAAVLGREAFAGIAPPGFFDVERVDPATGRHFRAPLLGLQRDRVSAYDLSLGGRVELWRDTLFGYVDVLLPINDDGFRSDVVPLIGLEAAF